MRIDRASAPPLSEGLVRLRVSLISLTTNNISYAVYGDQLGYWDVFPTGIDGYGHMPAWGYADVVESTADGVDEGERVWGYFPIAEQLVVAPEKVTTFGFVDSNPCRRSVPAIYSRYVFCRKNPRYRPDLEAIESLYRPLFFTSYTAAEFLSENSYFGARTVVLSSASSKTAYGLAWCLRGRGLETVGLTSEGNVGFVEHLGLYDQVIPYTSLDQVNNSSPVLYVDFAANPMLREYVHEHFGSSLRYDCIVGSTQGTDFGGDQLLSGPKPQFFFAADCLDAHRENGTLHAFLDRSEIDQLRFFEEARSSTPPWVRIVESRGIDAAADVVTSLLNNVADPSLGHVVRLD